MRAPGRRFTGLLVLAMLAAPAAAAAGGRDSASAAAGPRPAPPDTAALYALWRPLLAAELTGPPSGLRPQDLYKFLHQGVMGPAHATADTAAVRRRLALEWEQAASLPPDAVRPPLAVPLRPDGRLVRIDLVRLQRLTGGPAGAGDRAAPLDTLAAAFLATALRWPRDGDLLAALWSAVRADTSLWRGRFSTRDMDDLDARVAGRWPAVRHSEAYRRRTLPHYRVVAIDHVPPAWLQPEVRP